MTWKSELEKILRDQMPYAFLNIDKGEGERGYINSEDSFSEALGYILEFVEVERKKSFFKGFVDGAEAAHGDMADIGLLTFDKDISRIGAERAWLKTEAE